MRSTRGRRFKDLLEAYAQEIGCELTEAQRALIRDLVIHQLVAEGMQQEYMQSGELAYGQYSKATNAMRRCMAALGLTKRELKTDEDDAETLTPLDYIRSQRRPHRERLEE